jgi:hypothetical protein
VDFDENLIILSIVNSQIFNLLGGDIVSQSRQPSFIRVYNKELDPDLERIDALINDQAIDAAFSYKIAWRGRKLIPISKKVRAHLLKAIKWVLKEVLLIVL